MIGVSTERAPSSSLVVPHFIFASLSFLLLSIFLLLSYDELGSHYYHPKLLALTHIAALGWASMIIFGALYQLIPVVFETALYSEKLGKFVFWLFGASTLFIIHAFYSSRFGDLLPIAAVFLFISISLFCYNVMQSIRKAKKRSYSAMFVASSIIWLFLTALAGLLLSLNYKYAIFSQNDFHVLKLHAHIAIIGWLLFLVMGVASILLPMFLVSHQKDKGYMKRAFYLTHLALILFAVDWLIWKGSDLQIVYLLIFAGGMANFGIFIYRSYKSKLRKLDIGMKHSILAIILLALPILISLFITSSKIIDLPQLSSISILYGMSIFLGFFSNMILGQSYKTLPFIIWLHRYKSYVGKAKTPMPRELYLESIASFQFYSYILALVLLFGAFLFEIKLLALAGSVALLLTAILFNINIFLIVLRHKKVDILNK